MGCGGGEAMKKTVAVRFLVAMASLLASDISCAQAPRPALLVLSKDSNELEVIDPGTLQIVGRVGTGEVPHEVAVSASGKYAVATNYGPKMAGTTLSVIDLDTMKEIHRVPLPDLVGPHGAEFVGEKVWFTAEGAKAIALYNPATNEIEKR